MTSRIRRYACLYGAVILAMTLLIINADAHRWAATLTLGVIVVALLALSEAIDRDATRTPLPAGTLLARDAVRLEQLYASAIAAEHRRLAADKTEDSPEGFAARFAAAVMTVRDIELDATLARANLAVERQGALGAQRRQALDLAKFWAHAAGDEGPGLRRAAEELRATLNATPGGTA